MVMRMCIIKVVGGRILPCPHVVINSNLNLKVLCPRNDKESAMDLRRFREYLRTLRIAQLHALSVMEGKRLSPDQRILLRKEATKRKRWLSPSELESEEGMWLGDIIEDVPKASDEFGGKSEI